MLNIAESVSERWDRSRNVVLFFILFFNSLLQRAAFYLVAAIPVKKKNWPSLSLALPILLNCGVCER